MEPTTQAGAGRFVLSDPGALSSRAQQFLRQQASRRPFDGGLSGDLLRRAIGEVYDKPNERMVSLLEWAQTRYGGLTYPSGFFDAEVVFTPVCEPEDALVQLEISHVVQTGTPAVASLSADGTVFIGVDGHGVAEFATLDAVIECDSMFPAASQMAATMTSYLGSVAHLLTLADFLRVENPLGLREITEARGARTFWFASRSAMLYLCGAWSALGRAVPPKVMAWGVNDSSLTAVHHLIWR
ncbi:hypothetical protein Rhe02_89280 [Rhizocola hellebori]|uniref:Uncharacterized protein n=1 Tax=Rhizocola hellebori TaxID=1392758 RepID=A0A8J3QHR1_9ACTN|nr:hypothetical protein [Rhizocola hellebori]GIH10861.1 hypothetical protein Rhe02_89280 [Rhizocola hellebori]